VLIPVEQKPSARKLHASHILQVAAQCLLIKEIYTVRPPYGVVVLAGGVQERVVLSPALEHRLLARMQEMRELVAPGGEPGPRWAEPQVSGLRIWHCLLAVTGSGLNRPDAPCILAGDLNGFRLTFNIYALSTTMFSFLLLIINTLMYVSANYPCVSDGRMLTVSEVADTLRLKPETVRRWLRSGKLRGVSLGSDSASWRVPQSEVERLLAGSNQEDSEGVVV
jgi:excisionase family DNA binding protein